MLKVELKSYAHFGLWQSEERVVATLFPYDDRVRKTTDFPEIFSGSGNRQDGALAYRCSARGVH